MSFQITLQDGADVVQLRVSDEVRDILGLNPDELAEDIRQYLSNKFYRNPLTRQFIDNAIVKVT